MKPRLGSQLDELNSLFSRFDQPPGGQYSGWYQYFDRDINALLGSQVPSPFSNAYCGKGKLSKCQNDIWKAIDDVGRRDRRRPGHRRSGRLALGRATAEQIHFSPLPLKTMRYTNRPSGIQQVISFDGHRKNK